MSEELPQSLHSSTLNILGVELVVHTLDNGQRIVEAGGLEALFKAMETEPMTASDAAEFARAIQGRHT